MKHFTWTGLPARLAALLLAVLLTAGLAPEPAAAAGAGHFSDVPASHWAYQYVEQAYRSGAIVGTGGDPAAGTGVFSPDREMTYGEFLTMLASAFYPEELEANRQPGDPWYVPAFRTVLDHELTYITRERLMELGNTWINRYNASWILVNLFADCGGELPDSSERDAAAGKIRDWETVGQDHSAWPYYVSSVYALEIMSGVDSQGTFAGKEHITRASAAVIYTKLAGRLTGYRIAFGENWDLITVPGYEEQMREIFYLAYPRLVARWGVESTQSLVPVVGYSYEDSRPPVMATSWDYNGTGLRYVKVAVQRQQDYPPSYAAAHELVHVVANYSKLQSTWWSECLADYGDFRYYKWADEANFDRWNYFQLEDGRQTGWSFTAYGGQLFFAWMDDRYPTTPQGYGLIDAIHYAIKAGQITSDDVNDPKFNAVVRQITGYSTITQLHQQYLRELNAKTWVFRGFADYPDNYITENLPGVPNPSYPTGEGINLVLNSSVYESSGSAAGNPANNLVDGDRTTKWQAAKGDVTGANLGRDVQHNAGIDLGRMVSFDTYTLCHEGSQGSSRQNTAAWRLYYFDSQKNDWVLLDEVRGNSSSVTTRTVKPVTTQYLWLDILDASGNGDGIVRLYELELYDNR